MSRFTITYPFALIVGQDPLDVEVHTDEELDARAKGRQLSRAYGSAVVSSEDGQAVRYVDGEEVRDAATDQS